MQQSTDDQRIARIQALRREHDGLEAQAERVRQKLLREVYDAFPRNRGEDADPPRGFITKVVNAAGWTRAYITNIRDGRLAEDGTVIPADPRKGSR